MRPPINIKPETPGTPVGCRQPFAGARSSLDVRNVAETG
jgi:hypothetical protein